MKIKDHYLLFIIAIGFFLGCRSNKVYLDCDTNTIQNGYFKFDADSTFYYQKNGVGFKHSDGRWKKVSKTTFLLNSYVQDKHLPVVLEEKAFNDSIDSKIINISIRLDNLDSNMSQYYKVILVVNDSINGENPVSNPIFRVPRFNLRSLRFGITSTENIPTRMFDTLYTTTLAIDDWEERNYMKFRIAYNDILFNYIVINNCSTKFFKNKIYFNKYYLPLVKGLPSAKHARLVRVFTRSLGILAREHLRCDTYYFWRL
jgi:hypothetical protein